MRNFIVPAGSGLYGHIQWHGEDPEDRGTILMEGQRMAAFGSVTPVGKNPFVENYLKWEAEVVREIGGVLHQRL